MSGDSKVRAIRFVRSHLVAVIVGALAVGGVSYAALKLPAKSVGTKQLKKSSVTGKKVRDGSLRAADFGPEQLPSGPRGATGPQGAAAPQGATGPQGPTGPSTTAVMSGRADLPVGANRAFGIAGDAPDSASINAVWSLSPATPVTARNLSIRVDTAPGGTAGRVFILQDDGANTSLQCDFNGASTTCQDTVHAPVIAPGSLLNLFVLNKASGSSAATAVEFGFTLGP